MCPIGTYNTCRLLIFVQLISCSYVFVSAANDANATVIVADATMTTTETAGCSRPDYSICDSLPPRRQSACRMVLRMGAAARKAEREGDFTQDELPPPSVKLGLFRKAITEKDDDEKAQLPPRVGAELFACLNLSCLCNSIGGESLAPDQCSIGGTHYNSTTEEAIQRQSRDERQRSFGKAVRMEYRMLSDQQRQQFHAALRQLKHDADSYEYDRLAFLHSDPRMMPCAHSGPTFLLFHREYLKRVNSSLMDIVFMFEFALRAVDPSVGLPFWDSTMDQRLDNPADSIMWSDLFAGSSDENGNVVDGFLANWVTSTGDPVQRNLGDDGELLSEKEVNSIINRQHLGHIFGFPSRKANNTACTLPWMKPEDVLEFSHNNVHIWVGGDMYNLPTSPQDPIFFMHHSFIDFIWEQWRQKWQNRDEREAQFPPDSQIIPCAGSSSYLLNATMLPFYDPIVLNNVGLSNDYTDHLYTYAPRPTCKSAGGCGSPYLFCDTSNASAPLCCAKIKAGGDCAKFARNSEEPCYASACIGGRCEHNQRKMVVHSSDKSFSNESRRSNGTLTLAEYGGDGGRDKSYTTTAMPTSTAADEQQQSTTTTMPPSPSSHSSASDTAPTSAQQFSLTAAAVQQTTTTVPPCSGAAAGSTPSTATERSARPSPASTASSPATSAPSERECYDNHECCAQWAVNGSCRTAPRFMNTWCPGECRYDGCQPHSAVLSQCKRWAHFHEQCAHEEGWRAFKPGMVLKKPKTRSECQRNRHWMACNCPEACNDDGTSVPHDLADQCSSKMPKDYTFEPTDG